MSKIRIRNGPYAGREYTLGDAPLCIGRDADADIQILDRSASRFHSEIFPVGGMYFVRDLDSKNGTLVNDEQLTDEELLREEDIIRIGTTELIFESGIALADSDSGDSLSYDDSVLLTNTIEFRVDDLTDIEDESSRSSHAEARSLRILYQLGKLLSQPTAESIVAESLDFLLAALPADCAIIFMRENGNSKLVPKTVRTATQWSKPVIARSIIKRTLSENRAVLTGDAQQDRRFKRADSVLDNNIRSVLCVPMIVGGKTKGVLYLSRDNSQEPFEHSDLELISSCSVQYGMFYRACGQIQREQQLLWDTLLATICCMERGTGLAGRGESCARTVSNLAIELGVNPASQRRLRMAGLLHHLGTIAGDGSQQAHEDSLACFADIDEFDELVEFARACRERLDGSGPLGYEDQQLSSELRILSAGVAFEERRHADEESDGLQLIEQMEHSEQFDSEVLKGLKSAHLSGSLYR